MNWIEFVTSTAFMKESCLTFNRQKLKQYFPCVMFASVMCIKSYHTGGN